MCLAVPAKLIDKEGNRGKVELGGARINVGLDLVDDVKPGDYLIIHAGFALEKLDEEEARKRLSLFEELAHGGYFHA